jgi:hypothetical protein
MIDPAELERRIEALDTALESWRQGDFVIGTLGFIVRFNPELPLRPFEQDESFDSDLYEQDIEGLVILTQTCDIVRTSRDRPYVEVGPLVKVEDAGELQNIRRGAKPRYAYVPGTAPRMLVADLDRVMTVEKGLLATWTRETGCPTNQDQRDFSEALARKRARFAFPEDFVSLVKPLRSRVTQKHGKDSPEGKCLGALREIRVSATPHWDDRIISLVFWFIVIDGTDQAVLGLRRQCETWMNAVMPAGRFLSVDWDVVTLDELSARDYVSSDSLDLDHLSSSR